MALLLPSYLVWAYAARGLRWKTTRELAIGALLVLAIGAGLYGRNWVGYANITAVTGNLQATVLNNSLAQWVATELDLLGGSRDAPEGEPATDNEEQDPTAPLVRPALTPIQWWVKFGFSVVFEITVNIIRKCRQIDLFRMQIHFAGFNF